MDYQTVLREVETWPVDDRLRLVQDIWDQLADDGYEPELTEAMNAELDRRIAEMARYPDAVLSWGEIKDQMERLRGWGRPVFSGFDEGRRNHREAFTRLTAEWKAQAEFLASPTAIAELPAYRAIIDMGRAALPLILGELSREPDHWFVALKRITREDPVLGDAQGDLDRMAEAWLDWGRAHGLES